jgi:hypothetical protein
MLTLTITATAYSDNIVDLACAVRAIVDLIGVDWRAGSFENPTSNAVFKIEGVAPPKKEDEEEF